jgi:hypothetical protein
MFDQGETRPLIDESVCGIYDLGSVQGLRKGLEASGSTAGSVPLALRAAHGAATSSQGPPKYMYFISLQP